ncbi:MAG TPA: molybdopterin molybdotransferase MoeA, partial [Cyclobacteriaceae bacterium]|nr:molybdopterin molybdotransferase MoeA [Cyclobacteriaceae bacterium]
DFKVEGIQRAGQPRVTMKDPNNCIEVMTGAMLPIGCDTVIRYEDVSIVKQIAHVKTEVQKGQSVHTRGLDAKRGDTLLEPGLVISPAEISLMASVGRAKTESYLGLKTAVITTGDELVDVNQVPLPHQIRRSNAHVIQSALLPLGLKSSLFHLTDDRNKMEKELIKIFVDYNVIIMTGGVSKGKFDFVPEVLEALGVKNLIHQVSQKPGKPFWFGVSKRQTVFALPGNPVSTFLCFHRYIKPWILKSMGCENPAQYAKLGAELEFKQPLTYFLQVRVKNDQGVLTAFPQEGGGSGDFTNLIKVDGFLELPLDKDHFKKGDAFPFIPFRNFFK